MAATISYLIQEKLNMSLQIRSSKWILTDDDCAQYVRNLDEFKGNVFETIRRIDMNNLK